MTHAFPLTPLASPLFESQRQSLQSTLRELLIWQRDLRKWPVLSYAPDATPIISLYAKGALCGSAALSEGPPAERISRGFVQAVGDGRFGGLGAAARAELRCQLSYVRSVRTLDVDEVASQFEAGKHGLAIAIPGRPATLLPEVARDDSLDAEGMLQALEKKSDSSRNSWPRHRLYLFETESVLARPTETPQLERNPVTAASAWLSARVDIEGRVTFGVNPRTAKQETKSPMFHGQSAVLVRALLSQSGGRAAATRARRRLEVELARALAGLPVEQFPSDPALVASTLALAVMSGIELSDALMSYAGRPELLTAPWHAAQVVTALGTRAPDRLWQACVRHLEVEPWAPWTALAANARADSDTQVRAAAALIASVPEHGPYVGGVGPNGVPELSRTAATVEALLALDSSAARAACARGRTFLFEHQMHGDRCALTAHPELVHGAFPRTPVHDYLQIDVTGHALLALVGGNYSTRPPPPKPPEPC